MRLNQPFRMIPVSVPVAHADDAIERESFLQGVPALLSGLFKGCQHCARRCPTNPDAFAHGRNPALFARRETAHDLAPNCIGMAHLK